MIPNYIGIPKYPKMIKEINPDNFEEKHQIYIGDECDKYRGILKLRYPIKRGVFERDEDILALLTYIKSKFPNQEDIFRDRPVFVTEPLQNNYINRQKIAETLFTTFDASAVFFGSQPILSLFGAGLNTGIALESGDGITQCCGVYEGYSIPKSFRRYDFGGRDVTEYLQLLLRRVGLSFTTSSEFELAKTIKEQACQVSPSSILSYLPGSSKNSITTTPFSLPDGSQIKLGEEKMIAPEILFNPSLIGLEYLSFPEMVNCSISNVDIDLRKRLYQTVLITGGNTSFKGFKERFYQDLKNLISQKSLSTTSNTVKLRLQCPEDNRLYMAWLGASYLTELDKFKPLWITKSEFQEQGINILFKKTI